MTCRATHGAYVWTTKCHGRDKVKSHRDSRELVQNVHKIRIHGDFHMCAGMWL